MARTTNCLESSMCSANHGSQTVEIVSKFWNLPEPMAEYWLRRKPTLLGANSGSKWIGDKQRISITIKITSTVKSWSIYWENNSNHWSPWIAITIMIKANSYPSFQKQCCHNTVQMYGENEIPLPWRNMFAVALTTGCNAVHWHCCIRAGKLDWVLHIIITT